MKLAVALLTCLVASSRHFVSDDQTGAGPAVAPCAFAVRGQKH